jgi:D-alanyl-D-alanine dipeptidase
MRKKRGGVSIVKRAVAIIFSALLISFVVIVSFLTITFIRTRDAHQEPIWQEPILQEPPEPPLHDLRRHPGALIPFEELGNYIFYVWQSGDFELPVAGATGWAAIELPLHAGAGGHTQIIATLPMGQPFTILQESGDWWLVEIGALTGWVTNRLSMINLPDVIPSIVFRNPNTHSAMFRSSGRDIPNITGMALCNSRDFNTRLGTVTDIAAALYGMARKIGAAQQAALANGHTLIIYEAFRSHDVQELIYENLSYMYETDPVVRAGISTPPWNIRWFLARSPYNHQRGTAIDTSLGRIVSYEIRASGDHAFIHITEYAEYPMQTLMHELSIAAVVFSTPVHARSTEAWRAAEFSPAATHGTRIMHRYLTDAGLIPLASEWWHFNDLIHTDLAVEMNITGEFITDRTFSRPPPLR